MAKNELHCKGSRAMFSLLRKCKKLQLPVDIQLQLFDVLVRMIFESQWITSVKSTLECCGFPGVWRNQIIPCILENLKKKQLQQ